MTYPLNDLPVFLPCPNFHPRTIWCWQGSAALESVKNVTRMTGYEPCFAAEGTSRCLSMSCASAPVEHVGQTIYLLSTNRVEIMILSTEAVSNHPFVLRSLQYNGGQARDGCGVKLRRPLKCRSWLSPPPQDRQSPERPEVEPDQFELFS